MVDENVMSVSGLQEKILYDSECMKSFLLALSINVTAMFRDPSFYLIIREKVIPKLRTYPFVRIWLAGCSTGEEIYSITIVLQEEDLYDKCRIYATDMSETVLQKASEGIFPISSMKEYTHNYIKAGGKSSLSDYYTAKYDNAIFRKSLKKNIVFSQHNLVTDSSFNEFNFILCRNVMIYFNKSLQARVHGILYDSLIKFGVMGLGNKESIKFTQYESCYEELKKGEKLYRKIK